MDPNTGIFVKVERLSNMAVLIFTIVSISFVLTVPAQHSESGCLCSSQGTVNYTSCDSGTTMCTCKEGFIGANCSDCSAGFYATGTGDCSLCQCNEHGSISTECNISTGECSCKPGIGGPLCDRCTDSSHWLDGETCRPCDCTEYSAKCSDTNASIMCQTCANSVKITENCPRACGQGYYKDGDHICSPCPACQMAEPNSTDPATATIPAECRNFSQQCLSRCSHAAADSVKECSTCHSFSAMWNCTNIETPSDPAQNGSGKNALHNYYVYAAAGGGVLLLTAVISTVIYVRRRRNDQKPMMPLWTIELKQDDQVSFTDYNDVDVMYLDDSYLMEPSEVFTTSTDSMDERIGYKTLS
ncbi:uncharacterized protein [Diadema antillarum]|uniref:uncharacterized protein n=1 Tax=Diadema antillarum TaxID=105358 RepID=UPI003A863728